MQPKRLAIALVSAAAACGPFGAPIDGSAARERRMQPEPRRSVRIAGEPALFAPGIASTAASEIRLTISPDGRTALWFSRDRPGGPGGYDIWMSRRASSGWGRAKPVSFNGPTRDFDPAFSPDGRFVYFCSDRPGGMGGDDLYRVEVTASGFGPPENLGPNINSAGNEFAPMLSPDMTLLLYSSDRPGGAGRHDLFTARHDAGRFEQAQRLPGDINTADDEFDATFLSDSATIVFARARDFRTDRVDLFWSSFEHGRYGAGKPLPLTVNSSDKDTYGPMLDWSAPDRFTFSGQRAGAPDMELYLVHYRLESGHSD